MPCDTSTFTLKFDNTAVGDQLLSLSITAKLVEDVRVRHNYWAAAGLIDSGYPALVWSYVANIYKASSGAVDSRTQAVLDYAALTDLHASGNKALGVWLGSTQLLAFGNCALNDVSLSEPSAFLEYPVGVYQLTFLGVTKPSTPAE